MWLAQHDLGTVDRVAFERWRAQGPAHAIAFARAWAAWEQVGAARLDAAYDDPAAAEPEAPSRLLSRRAALRTAVAGGIALAGGGLLTSRAYAWSRAETAIGETRRLQLPDGSSMMLNTDSAVAWRFSGTHRLVQLERGEVALELRPSPALLSVTGAGLAAQLSAGRFNVRLRDGALDVLVVRGVAQPARSGMTPSKALREQTLLVTSRATSVQPASAQKLAAVAAWPKGEILFNDEPLAFAVEEYNRYLQAKIVIVDPGLSGIRVGGRFTSTDPATFLDALQTTLNIRVHPTDTGYLLTKKFTT